MRKALTQMNVKLDKVISDIASEPGRRIVRAIVAGARDALRLATMRHGGIRASEEEVVKSSQGNWREELFFALKLALYLYDSYQSSIVECDEQLARVLGKLAFHDEPDDAPLKSGRGRPVKPPKFDLRTVLYRTCGVNLTRIDGIDMGTALKMIAEVGPDLSHQDRQALPSWLGLCPGTKISGGKVLSGASKRTHCQSPSAGLRA